MRGKADSKRWWSSKYVSLCWWYIGRHRELLLYFFNPIVGCRTVTINTESTLVGNTIQVVFVTHLLLYVLNNYQTSSHNPTDSNNYFLPPLPPPPFSLKPSPSCVFFLPVILYEQSITHSQSLWFRLRPAFSSTFRVSRLPTTFFLRESFSSHQHQHYHLQQCS